MQAKIFESMHLIVDVGTADKLTAVGYIIVLVEYGQRVLGGKFIPSVRPCGITIVTSLQPLEVATQVVHRLRQSSSIQIGRTVCIVVECSIGIPT